MPPKKPTIPNYKIHKYAVIRLENEEDDEERLFECIPDRWFVDENKTSCFWPPTTGKSYTVRAINCEKPEDSWNIYECTVISDGYSTYNSGFKIVKEKCNQKYNTSSAEEKIKAEKFRREHPVLAMKKNDGNIEQIFAKPSTSSKRQSVAKKNKNDKVSSKKIDGGCTSVVLTENRSIPSTSIQVTENSTVDNSPDERENCHEVSTDVDPENPSNSIDVGTKTANEISSGQSVHSLNELPRSKSRSVHSGRSRSGSRSDVSRSGRCPSKNNRSHSIHSSGTETSVSRYGSLSDASRSGRSSTSNNRSHSSRSGRSRTGESRSGSLSDSSDTGRAHSRNNRSHSSVSVGSCTARSTGQRRGSSTAVRSTDQRHNRSRSKTNRSYFSRPSTSMAKHSKSKPDRSRRSSSELNHSRSSSRSSARNGNDQRRPRRVSSDRKNKRLPSPERDRHSKRLRIGSHQNSRPAFVERHSSSETSSLSARPKNNNLHNAHSVQEIHSRSSNNPSGDVTVHDLMKVVRKVSETIEQNSQQLRENDRRLHRMEVTVNKIFVLVGDLNGNSDVLQDELINDQGFEIPQLPIRSTNELTVMKRKLQNKEFCAFFLQHEKDFCCPTKRSTDTSTISKYLMRFISLRVRSKITLKENVDDGTTIFKDYHEVYPFLTDVMKLGYKSAKKKISFDDAHTALRIVWGRSKQQYRESKSKRRSNPKRK